MKIQHIKETAVRVLMITLFLVMLSLLISYIMRDSRLSLKDVLFWVGSVPIAIFSVRMFAPLSGRGWRNYKGTEDILDQSPEQQLLPESSAAAKRTSSGLAWVTAGLLVWLVSYVI